VLTAEPGRLDGPGEDRPDAGHTVRGELLAVARAADHDAEGARLGDDGLGRREAERRVVVERVVDVRTVVDDVVPPAAQVLHEVVLELESGMVGADVKTHGAHSDPDRRGGSRLDASRPTFRP